MKINLKKDMKEGKTKMKYVFFDIECSNGGIGAICSFGYVITDESFNVIIQRDIVMNPPGKFKLTGRVGRPDVMLAYPEEVFRESPKFYYYHEEISNILTADDQIVIGHSAINDAIFLNKSCERYKKPYINFKYLDTQKIFSRMTANKNQVSLERAMEAFEISLFEQMHKSDVDARATMELTKKYCEKEGTSLAELVEKYIDCTGENNEGVALYYGETIESKREKREKRAEKSKNNRIRPQKEGTENMILKGRENHVLFLRMIDYAEPKSDKIQILKGKKVCISMNYEVDHFKEMIHIIQKIKDAGGEYVLKASLSDVFATFECYNEDFTPRNCSRFNHIKESERVDEINIISLDELLAMLGTTREEIEEAEPLNISYLLDSKFSNKILV